MKTRQTEFFRKAHSLFGDVATSKIERALRFLEEALEAVQVAGVEPRQILGLVERVYSREPGKPSEELGGAVVTLECFAEAMGYDLETLAETEFARFMAMWHMNPERLTNSQARKKAAGLTADAAPDQLPRLMLCRANDDSPGGVEIVGEWIPGPNEPGGVYARLARRSNPSPTEAPPSAGPGS